MRRTPGSLKSKDRTCSIRLRSPIGIIVIVIEQAIIPYLNVDIPQKECRKENQAQSGVQLNVWMANFGTKASEGGQSSITEGGDAPPDFF
jgi:hypothetical protein